MTTQAQANLTQDLNVSTEKIGDISLRVEIEDAARAMKIDPTVVALTDFRDRMPQVRQQAQNGAVVLVADRANPKTANETTMVLSLATFQQFVAKVLANMIEKHRRRSNTAEFLAGLTPAQEEASSFTIDFDREARAEAVRPSDLKL